MKTKIIQFLLEEDGITSLEYGVLAAVVAGLVATVFSNGMNTALTALLTQVTSAVKKAAGG